MTKRICKNHPDRKSTRNRMCSECYCETVIRMRGGSKVPVAGRYEHTELPEHNYLKFHYDLSLRKYVEMLELQGHACAICKKQPKNIKNVRTKLHVDHCHETKKVRGLLCGPCNTQLGVIEKWIIRENKLWEIIEYLNTEDRR